MRQGKKMRNSDHRKIWACIFCLGVGWAAASSAGCTAEPNLGPWLSDQDLRDRGPGSSGVGGFGGFAGTGGMGGTGGVVISDCSDPAVEAQLIQEVNDALYIAQLCDPSIDAVKCDLFVPGMCCEEVVDPGYMDQNMPNVQAYLEVLQKWKDAGCACPASPPVCPPHEPIGSCDPTGFPAENQGICKKI